MCKDRTDCTDWLQNQLVVIFREFTVYMQHHKLCKTNDLSLCVKTMVCNVGINSLEIILILQRDDNIVPTRAHKNRLHVNSDFS